MSLEEEERLGEETWAEYARQKGASLRSDGPTVDYLYQLAAKLPPDLDKLSREAARWFFLWQAHLRRNAAGSVAATWEISRGLNASGSRLPGLRREHHRCGHRRQTAPCRPMPAVWACGTVWASGYSRASFCSWNPNPR